MKKTILSILICVFTLPAYADRDYYNPGFEDEGDWQEKQENLPEFPDLKDTANWISLNIDQQQKSEAMVYIPSFYRSNDKSIRYILNIRSVNGFDNLSVDGINCTRNTYKSFAFGDTHNKRWIEAKTGDWQKIGSALYQQNRVRGAIKEAICSDMFPKDEAGVRKRLEKFNH